MLETEKLLETAKAAIDEAKHHAEEIERLTQYVQHLEEQARLQEQALKELAEAKESESRLRLQADEALRQLKSGHAGLEETLAKESARATSLQHEVERLRHK